RSIVAGVLLVALLAPWLAPHDPAKPDFMAFLQAPDVKYLLGTDEVGRDLLSLLIYGARASIRAGLTAVAIAIAIGVPIGLLSGYLRGWVDQLVFMRLADAMIACPTIVLALALAAALGGNLTTAMLAIGIGSAPAFIRLARAQAMSLREQEFVEAARALGNRPVLVMLRHVFPNMIGPLLVQTSLAIAERKSVVSGT